MIELPTLRGPDLLAKYNLVPVRPEVIDSSMLRTFMDCPSKFYLRYVLGLSPRRTDPVRQAPLDWGTCWHNTLYEYFRSGEDVVAALKVLDESYPPYLTPETDAAKRSKERMAQQFFDYVERWQKRKSEYEILRFEQFFDVYDEEVGLRWCGRIDRIERAKRNKKVRVRDYKTTGKMGDRYFDQFEISFQFPGYVWAAARTMTDDVKEITADVMYTVTPTSRQTPGGYKFFERTFRYDEFRLREWQTNVKRIVDRMNALLDAHLYNPEVWDKNWTECTRYGLCSFFPVHASTPRGDARLVDLRDNYRIERWDPSGEAEED